MGDAQGQTTVRPSVAVATLLVVVALGYAAYLSPHHWTAAGLACMTGSAIIAAPQLITHLLDRATHPTIHRAARVLARSLRLFSLVLYALAVLIVVLAALGGLHQAITVIVFFVIIIGFLEVVARQTANVFRDLALGGDLDERLGARFDPPTRWALAGAFFLVGTLLQLIGTFVE